MKHFPLFATLIALCSIFLASCWGEEDFSVSPNLRLEFSRDTVAFDTVIAGQPTNTYTFFIYNRTSRGVRIEQAALGKGAQSPFRVNLDGTFVGAAAAGDWEIAAGDSLRGFVELTAPITGQDAPQPLEDELRFHLAGGATQHITLTAAGQDVLPLTIKVLERDTLLSAQRPYLISDSLVVAAGATLQLAAGTRLFFKAGASLIVHGTLQAHGTLEQPIVFRGARLGEMFSGQPYDRIPNQWGGVVLSRTSVGNVLNFCDIHSGTYGIRCDSTGMDTRKLLLENSVIHNIGGHGLYAKDCHTEVGNSQISNAAGDCVHLIGGRHRFVHCTLAQFYPFVGERGVALRFINTEGTLRHPLHAATFLNTLITGYNSDDLMAHRSARYTADAFNYDFRNCLIHTPAVTDDAHFVDCLFEDDSSDKTQQAGNFTPPFDDRHLLYRFSLSPSSRAVGRADFAATRATYPNDRNGHPRLTDGKADIGCYEAPIPNP